VIGDVQLRCDQSGYSLVQSIFPMAIKFPSYQGQNADHVFGKRFVDLLSSVLDLSCQLELVAAKKVLTANGAGEVLL